MYVFLYNTNYDFWEPFSCSNYFLFNSLPGNSTLKADFRTDDDYRVSDDAAEYTPASSRKKIKMCKDHELFDLVLTEEEWKMIKTDSTSEYPTKRLEPWVWANVIDQAFHRQYRMRCAFVYQDSYVTLSADQLTYKIAVNGK